MIRYLYVFVSGFLLMLTLNLYNDWSYEREILVNLREHVYRKCKTRDITSLVDTALYYSNLIQNPSTLIYGDKKFNTLKRYYTSSSFNNFYFGKDACGAYSSFFGRLLSSMGYKNKTVQLSANGKRGAHMVVGIEHDGKLLVVDPLFNHVFKDANGKISDIHDIAANWDSYYSKHVPAGYLPIYNYQEGWTFTNWNKFGAFSKGLYNLLCKISSKERVDDFSFYRYYRGFGKYNILLTFFLFVFTFVKSIQLNFPLNKYEGLFRRNKLYKLSKAA